MTYSFIRNFYLTFMVSVIFQLSSCGQKASPAKTASGVVNGVEVSIAYHSPSVKGRTIWGGLVPYDKVWRTGANNATTITTGKALKVGGKSLAAGTYALFTIPKDGQWTVIINEVADQWGAYNYDPAKDVLRVEASTSAVEFTESFTISVLENEIALVWDKLKVNIPVE